MKNNLLVIAIAVCILSLTACGQETKNKAGVYKYQDREQVVYCKQVDTSLVKEAFYSFKEDIASYYNNQGYEKGTLPYYHNGFVKYINSLKENNAAYNLVASEHSKILAKKLKEYPEIWTERDGEIYPNLEDSFLKCITQRIEDYPLKSLVNNVYKQGKLKRKNVLPTYYKKIGQANTDKNFALFLALDTFYSYLGEETKK